MFIVGEDELARGEVTVRRHGGVGDQESVPRCRQAVGVREGQRGSRQTMLDQLGEWTTDAHLRRAAGVRRRARGDAARLGAPRPRSRRRRCSSTSATAHGVTQVVVRDERARCWRRPSGCAPSSSSASSGAVRARGRPRPSTRSSRPARSRSLAREIRLLNEAKTPPFPIAEDAPVSEDVRLRYRYLDLRRPRLQHNLGLRHRVTMAIRKYFDAHGLLGDRDADPRRSRRRKARATTSCRAASTRASSTRCRSRRRSSSRS